MSTDRQLKQELLGAGAKPAEVAGLLELAEQLKNIDTNPTRARRWRGWPIWSLPRSLGYIAASLVLILTGSGATAVALGAQPGQPLYVAKAGAENLEMDATPTARPAVMMERSQEVAALTAGHQSDRLILSTLASYNAVANQVSSSGNYPAWDYCASQLRQARSHASGKVRVALSSSLSRFKLGDN